MTREEFLKLSAISLTTMTISIKSFGKMFIDDKDSEVMPVLFMGHGSPMNVLESNAFTAGWEKLGREIKPKAILCISAHWYTRGTYVTAMERPKTIYDFYGFPDEMYQIGYNCPGSPVLASELVEAVKYTTIKEDHEWGLDHGTWCILAKMYPKADIPVFQMSIDYTKPMQFHYDLARELSFLRKKGVLILGSGNIVHNLRLAKFSPNPEPYDWAIEFDQLSKDLLLKRQHADLINYKKLGKSALLSIPTEDHYIPLIYTIGLQGKQDELTFPVEGMAFGSGSMRSVRIDGLS